MESNSIFFLPKIPPNRQFAHYYLLMMLIIVSCYKGGVNMIKINTENWVYDNEGILLEAVTIESENNGTMFISIGLDESNNNVCIVSTNVNFEGELDVPNFLETVENESFVESFASLELARQFYNEIKQPLKLAKFIKDRKK